MVGVEPTCFNYLLDKGSVTNFTTSQNFFIKYTKCYLQLRSTCMCKACRQRLS